jgi:hypothetical protein
MGLLGTRDLAPTTGPTTPTVRLRLLIGHQRSQRPKFSAQVSPIPTTNQQVEPLQLLKAAKREPSQGRVSTISITRLTSCWNCGTRIESK